MVSVEENTSCSLCGSEQLDEVLNLPDFPLTGIYVENFGQNDYPNVDQGLNLCPSCGHAQLRTTLDPDYVYGNEYFHRSSASPIASRGNDFFFQFLTQISRGQMFERVVEVGCNDLYLIKKMAPLGKSFLGIDPIWRGNEPEPDDRLKILGKFVEEVDFQAEMGGQPDLVVSAHTFEHLPRPGMVLKRLISEAAEGALFLIEVPGFDSLLNICRFDQVFHQHIQYFSLASFSRFIEAAGCHYVDHTFNYSYWGGTMLVAFRKGTGGQGTAVPKTVQPSAPLVKQKFNQFTAQLEMMMDLLARQSDPIYGFGAAQMLPALAYHMKTDLAFLRCIYDDNPDRIGRKFPNLTVSIEKLEPGTLLNDGTVLITALDSTRPILNRLQSLQPRFILRPLFMF